MTHLGGHRFAPNLLTLPNACLYGRVSARLISTNFLAATERGEAGVRRICVEEPVIPPAVQAAEALLGAEMGCGCFHAEALGVEEAE